MRGLEPSAGMNGGATAFESEGLEFESLRAHQQFQWLMGPSRLPAFVWGNAWGNSDRVMHLAINSGTDLALFNAWLTYIADKGWTDKAFVAASTKDFDKAVAANKTSLEEAARITGLTADQIRQSAEWIAQPKAGGARRRTMFAYEKGLIWGNDNYRTNGALVNVALATGNVGRPGGSCVRMGGHQEGYSRPDYPGSRPAFNYPQFLRRSRRPTRYR
jgi:arsenite oxidase large subunit